MIKQFLIADVTQPIEPNSTHPFVVFTQNNQPVGLVALRPFAVNRPPSGTKTAVILVVPSEVIASEEEFPKILGEAYIALHGAINAEGVILVDEDGQINGVLPKAKILVPDSKDIQKRLNDYLLNRGQQASDYQPLASKEPNVIVSTIYTCPEPGCISPDVKLWQKGQRIPPCPQHNKPRLPRKIMASDHVT